MGAGLTAATARAGVYGSPHVERVTERVRVAATPLADDALAASLDAVLDAREARGVADATWFDVISAAGLLAFKNAGVDWAVVEVGLGGRLDSTNVLSAPVAVVTNIALEHADIIGPTIRDIAYEKAGIFSRGCQPVVGMSHADPLAAVFDDEARAVGARPPCYVPPAAGAPLSAHNAALARCALRSALPDRDPADLLPDDAVARVLSSLPGRMEPFRVRLGDLRAACGGRGDTPETAAADCVVDVTLDGGHVAESVRRVLAFCWRLERRRTPLGSTARLWRRRRRVSSSRASAPRARTWRRQSWKRWRLPPAPEKCACLIRQTLRCCAQPSGPRAMARTSS